MITFCHWGSHKLMLKRGKISLLSRLGSMSAKPMVKPIIGVQLKRSVRWILQLIISNHIYGCSFAWPMAMLMDISNEIPRYELLNTVNRYFPMQIFSKHCVILDKKYAFITDRFTRG